MTDLEQTTLYHLSRTDMPMMPADIARQHNWGIVDVAQAFASLGRRGYIRSKGDGVGFVLSESGMNFVEENLL